MNRRKFLIGTTAVGVVMAIGAKFGLLKPSPLTGGKWSLEFDGVYVGPFDIAQAAPVTIPAGKEFAIRVFLPTADNMNSRTRKKADRTLENPVVAGLLEWPNRQFDPFLL